jgi:hypothetical protein
MQDSEIQEMIELLGDYRIDGEITEGTICEMSCIAASGNS